MPRVRVDPFRRWHRRLDWRPGDHLTIIGPTGSGKSHLAARLVSERRFAVVVATKPDGAHADPSLAWYLDHGFVRATEWPPPRGAERVLLWPKFRHRTDRDSQKQHVGHALDEIFAEGAWTVYVDEAHYVSDDLALTEHLRLLWRQGRSQHVSLVVATQRPAWVPLEAYSQATHLCLFRTTDDRDLGRLAEISGTVDKRALEQLVAELPQYAFVHADTRHGRLTVSRAPKE